MGNSGSDRIAYSNVRNQRLHVETPRLPEDVSTYIPQIPYRWLLQWLTDEEILRNRIGWSQEKESIIFPVFDKQGNLRMWQCRYFGTRKGVPKYLTKGFKSDILHVLGGYDTDRVVVVEDLISAIVVSRVENAMPLWGSSLNLKLLRILARHYGHLKIWLDSDKLENAFVIRQVASLMFESASVVHTELDPKYHDKEQIQQILGEGVDKSDKS